MQNSIMYAKYAKYDLVSMPTVAEWSRRTYPAPLGAGGVGSIGGGRRGFDPGQLCRTKHAFIPPLAICNEA
jgi:hypothetical protein